MEEHLLTCYFLLVVEVCFRTGVTPNPHQDLHQNASALLCGPLARPALPDVSWQHLTAIAVQWINIQQRIKQNWIKQIFSLTMTCQRKDLISHSTPTNCFVSCFSISDKSEREAARQHWWLMAWLFQLWIYKWNLTQHRLAVCVWGANQWRHRGLSKNVAKVSFYLNLKMFKRLLKILVMGQ